MAETPRKLATFTFEGSPPHAGTPVVNGHELTTVTSFDVHAGWNALPTVTLTLIPADALRLVIGRTAHVEVADETREALISLGWTPPADG